MTITPADLDKLEVLERIATVSDWYFPGDGRWLVKDKKGGDAIFPISTITNPEQACANAELIAASRNSLKGLIALARWAMDARNALEYYDGLLGDKPIGRLAEYDPATGKSYNSVQKARITLASYPGEGR